MSSHACICRGRRAQRRLTPWHTTIVIPSTRAGRTWVHVLPALILVTVTLVFVLQNLRSSKVSFVTASARLPLGLDLVIAAGHGALIVLASDRSGFSNSGVFAGGPTTDGPVIAPENLNARRQRTRLLLYRLTVYRIPT